MKPSEARERLQPIGPSFTTSEARAAGLHWEDIYALRDSGDLIELSRGVFRLRAADPTPYLDLIAVSKRVPKGTICLISALWFWELTDEMPSRVDIAVRRGSTRPRVAYPPTSTHIFDAETYELERREIVFESGDAIYVYSAERSVVDAMRVRHNIGADIAFNAVREYLRRRGAAPGRLLEIARPLRAEEPLAAALEVLSE